MFDEFGNPIYGDSIYDDSVYDDSTMGYGVGSQCSYKPLKASLRNVQDVISSILGVYTCDIDFVKLDMLPDNIHNWKHSCYLSGVIQMRVCDFIFEDGSKIVYATCPYFPKCNKVHYYIEKSMY